MLEVGKRYFIYKKTRVEVEGKIEDFGCRELREVEVLKINKQSYTLKDLRTMKNENIKFNYSYNSEFCRIYKEGTLEDYDIVGSDEELELVKKEFTFYTLVNSARWDIKRFEFGIEEREKKITALKEEICDLEKMNKSRRKQIETIKDRYNKGMEILKELKGEC